MSIQNCQYVYHRQNLLSYESIYLWQKCPQRSWWLSKAGLRPVYSVSKAQHQTFLGKQLSDKLPVKGGNNVVVV